MVGCHVHRGKYGRKLVLSGRNLVVAGFGVYAEFPQFAVEVVHIGYNAGANVSEVVVFEFLTFGRPRSEKRSARKNQVLSLFPQFAVYQKVFLFGSYRGYNALSVCVAECAEKTHGAVA